jgi:hypothetical protein
MSDAAEILMLSGVARFCPDCLDESLFLPVDECEGDHCEFCCTSCGAAILIDPALEVAISLTRVA